MKHIVRLFLLVGSAWLSVMDRRDFTQGRYVAPLDNLTELQKYSHLEGEKNYWPIPLGGSSTSIQSIVQSVGTDEQVAAMAHLSTIQVHDGLGQVKGFGDAAMLRELSPERLGQLEHLESQLRDLAHGSLTELRILFLSGISGGTGGAGLLRLFQTVTDLFSSHSLSITATVHLLGPLSFEARGPRTLRNAGCSVAEWAAVLAEWQNPKVGISVVCHEVQPVGDDVVQRDRLVQERVYVLEAPVVEESLSIARTNHSADGRFGNVLFPRTAHFERVSDRQVLSDLAAEYLGIVDSLLEPTGSLEVDRIEFDYVDQSASVPTAQSLLDELELFTSRSGIRTRLTESCSRQISARAIAILPGRDQLPVGNIREVITEPVTTPGEAKDRLRLLSGLKRAVHGGIGRTEQEVLELSARNTELANAAAAAVLQLGGCGFSALFRSAEALRERSIVAIELFLESSRLLGEAKAELTCLVNLQDYLEGQYEALLSRLERLAVALESSISRGCDVDLTPHVIGRPIDECFGPLMLAAGRDPADEASSFRRTLKHSVGTVTLHGLAKIVGAKEATVEAVVDAAIQRDGDQSPPWGGAIRSDKPDSNFVVYPYVAPETKSQIERHHERIGTHFKTAFADETAPTRNVIKLELRHGRGLSDFFTPLHEVHVTKALESELGPLFMSEPERVLKVLGREHLLPINTERAGAEA